MEKMTYDKLKKLEAEHQRHRQAKKRLKVYYGWSKINKIQKREAIAVAFENEEGAGWENSRSGKSLRKTMTVCYERYQTEKELSDVTVPLKVAVMGCVVNGLGEGREADVGIAGGKTGGVLFVRGQEPKRVEGDLADQLIREVRKMVGEK